MKRKTVIVFEPDQDISSIMCYSLEAAGFEPIVGNSHELLEEIQKYKPSVVILDEWVLQRVRPNLKNPVRPPFLLTSTSANAREELLQNERDAFLEKPFNLGELEQLVHDLSRSRRRLPTTEETV